MMNGVLFGNKNSKDDYGAIMNYARITPPSIKENYVDIAGGDSSIDLSEAVGGVVFEDGKISFKFTLFTRAGINKMKNELHGKRLRILLEREPDFYYEGRLAVTSEQQVGNIHELYLDARVAPYKLEKQITIHNEEINGTKEIMLFNERMPVMPEITVKGDIQLCYEENRFALKTGLYNIPEITFYEGINRINVSGSGSIRLEYRKGMLI